MSRNQIRWIIRTEGGAIKGPVETEVILRMIRDGIFGGHEQISRYPDGQWTTISREPEFYDSLMEALEGAIQQDQEEQRRPKDIPEETIFMPPPPNARPRKEGILIPTTPPPQKSAPEPTPQPPPRPSAQTIELKNLAAIKKERLWKVARGKPGILLLAALCLAVLFIFVQGGDSAGDKISLLAPGSPGTPLSDPELKKKYRDALNHVEKDTFEDYLEAQNKLVTLVEGAPGNLEIRSVLCMVYKELWPFAKQDNNDQKTVATVSQTTRVLDVTSPFGSLCEAVKLIASGRHREAKGAVENILEVNEAFSMRPVVYSMKAEILEADKELPIALRYFEQAAQDWETWLKPKVRLGFVLYQSREYQRALDVFNQVLKINPKHKVAQLGLGFTEYYGFRQLDSAAKRLSSALSARGRITRPIESEGHQVLAEIQIDRGDMGAALSSAEKSYQLNPNNEAAHQLVLRLGGSDKLKKNDKNQNNEMIYLGDQYVRQGDCLSAQAEYKAAFEIDSKNGTAALKAAKCLWQLNQSYEAIEWLNRAMRAEPKLMTSYVLQADYLSQRYDFSGASQALANATRMSPNNYEVLRGMALLEFRKNNMPSAINYGLRALKVYAADIETYILLSKANLAMAQGITSVMKKDLEKRDAAYKDAVRYATKAVELDATNADAQITYANLRAATEGVDVAVSYLRELIKKYSFSYEYKVALADVYKNAERWNDARLVFEQVTETDPRNKKAWLGFGESLRATGLNDRALKAFLQAAVLDPTDGEALFQAGKLYIEVNRFEEGLQQFQRVKSINPNFPRTNYYAGRAAFLMGRKEEGLKYAREEKRLNPNLADAYLLTAEILSSQQAFGECAAEYAQALKLRPAGAEIYVKAAQCYRQAGSIDIAETMLTLAMERESGYPDIYKEQGAIFEMKGEVARARQAYRYYIELAPLAPDRRDIEARLRRLGG